tara:strand:+ start:313 stop:564 length:252 start_codon:yes stop_codon:yes gene_type:complete
MDEFKDQDEINKIADLWEHFHKLVAQMNDNDYDHLVIAGVMQAYALKLYRMKLDDNDYRGMLNYIFVQHQRFLHEDEPSQTIH